MTTTTEVSVVLGAYLLAGLALGVLWCAVYVGFSRRCARRRAEQRRRQTMRRVPVSAPGVELWLVEDDLEDFAIAERVRPLGSVRRIDDRAVPR